MSRVLAYDVSRLFVGPLFLTPRGIDRVDLALARHVFADARSPNLGILPTPWGTRAYPAALMRSLLDRLEHLWSEQVEADSDPQLQWLIQHMHSPLAVRQSAAFPAALGLRAKIVRQLRMLLATGLKLGRPVRCAVPREAVYVNIGQLGLAVPPFFRWLAERKDVTCAIMLHDVIPIEYPHLVSPAHVDHHTRMVRTVVDHADRLIFNTDSARQSVEAAMQHWGGEVLPSLVRPLPLQTAFAEVTESIPELDGVNYFVVVSTIEPRKNHELLLRVWQQLIMRMGPAAPHLVIVGALGYDAERILAVLEDRPLLRTKIHIVSGLSSKALAGLTMGATAMLCPSLAEGFGLPLLEASALGVPAIASNIAAHQEVANGKSVLLPADDVHAWEQAITALLPPGPRTRPAIPGRMTEAAYCEDVLGFLNAC
jgi:glycosyltransferase involved in cell wall biosynthesis